MFGILSGPRAAKPTALLGVFALVSSLALAVGLAAPAPAEASFKPTLTVTPISATKVRVEGKYPFKSGGKVTALYVMACANPGKNRPSSTYCEAGWSGGAGALTIAPKGADSRTKKIYGDVLDTVGTVSNGVWRFSVVITLPKTIKANGKTIKCTISSKTCGVGTRLSATVSTSSTSADKYVVPTKKASTLKVSASALTANKAGRATVKVTVPAVSKPTGKLVLTVNGKRVEKTLKSSALGKTTITIPKLKRGSYSLKVAFTPTGSAKYASKSSSRTIKISVK